MLFMNDYDTQVAAARYSADTAKGRAVRILAAHIEAVNSSSDGWAYWRAPVAAAKRLMELIQGPPISETTATECLRRALVPLKAFYTKHPTVPRPANLQ